jgi:glycosyltransferase involved in cell wall biosynthesis
MEAAREGGQESGVSPETTPTGIGDRRSGLADNKKVNANPTGGVSEGARQGEPVSVLLFRNIPEHGSRSMKRFADEMTRGLAAQSGVRARETTIHASRLHGYSLGRRLDRYSSLFMRYPLHARRQSADVYHVLDHSYGHLLGWIPAERAVITCHDLMLLHAERENIGFRGRRLVLSRFRWETSFLRRAALVACVSEATASDVASLLRVDSSRIRVIPNGISSVFVPMDAYARSEARRRIDPTGRRALVLHVSTGGAYKNVPATLRVIGALRSRDLDPMLLRVGKPLSAQQVALARELDVFDLICELGGVSDDELARLYAASDVLLFPSRWEGFGAPPLEALACGTPSVVASECRSVVDLVGDAALAVPADDVPALAGAVLRIVRTPGLRELLVARGRARVAALTWERTVDAYVGAYEEIAHTASRPGAP